MIRVGIIGATGYTALELIKILLRHPEVVIECVTSRENLGVGLDKTHAQLRDCTNLVLEEFDPQKVADRVDFAFCCLPHGASAESVKRLHAKGVRVVDFSADYRLSSLDEYQTWYETDHPHMDMVGKVPYGLPEFFRSEIEAADLVANPGCFPTSAILGIAPLIKAGLINTDAIIVDAKTGVSGAGRKPSLPFHYPECNESTAAYKVGSHRHQPEMEDVIQRCSGSPVSCLFTPHLVPMERGILSTIYTRLNQDVQQQDLLDCLKKQYRSAPFVRVTADLPATRHVSGTNFCDLTVRVPSVGKESRHAIVISCLDNLIKGASGAAVQNFNLMNGFDERTALL